ncbi:MAG: hypothetical protein ACKOQS_28005 [Dolichospermum sp.]
MKDGWGFDSYTVNSIFLEYHNIIKHENPSREDKVRIQYNNFDEESGAGLKRRDSSQLWTEQQKNQFQDWYQTNIEETIKTCVDFDDVEKKNDKILVDLITALQDGTYSLSTAKRILNLMKADIKSLNERLGKAT